jgi:hypothetical protein
MELLDWNLLSTTIALVMLTWAVVLQFVEYRRSVLHLEEMITHRGHSEEMERAQARRGKHRGKLIGVIWIWIGVLLLFSAALSQYLKDNA